MLKVVAGLNLKNLHPRVFDPASEYFLEDLRAVMISYADISASQRLLTTFKSRGLRATLGIPEHIEVFLDNGSFAFSLAGIEVVNREYAEFVDAAQPDWKPISQDFIPLPSMSRDEQLDCMQKTMVNNIAFASDGYAPVIHVCKCMDEYLYALRSTDQLRAKSTLALGGLVPHLLRSRQAGPIDHTLQLVQRVRTEFADRKLHVFGVGGNATIHIASLLGVNSADSAGWRNRAARGIIQLPGTGERMVAELGSWRGRRLSDREKEALKSCGCPACTTHGPEGLTLSGTKGFCNRATHNLWVLLREAIWVDNELRAGTYDLTFRFRLDSTNYLPAIQSLTEERTHGKDVAPASKPDA